jgi:hypothetical protein
MPSPFNSVSESIYFGHGGGMVHDGINLPFLSIFFKSEKKAIFIIFLKFFLALCPREE